MIVNKTRIIIVYSVFKDPLQTCFKMYIKHFALIHNVVLISIFPSNSSVVRKKKNPKKHYCFSLIKNSDFTEKSVLDTETLNQIIS